ncbi:MAG: hypothetical protein E5Y73_25155 [Mesorhizobium sp.]|uniref:hypothetical protein n=1 Tax=Mesorhizobium sp. TaxID=1871066 RepID=UPI001210E257|nr:hypothetical protein [Mesorhizobium sp.]TIL87501.1 MAG: hypothetical protein E5Y73_25155 [Mesorhizobium sp.]
MYPGPPASPSWFHESGKAAFALLAEPGTGKYVGPATTLGRDMRERLWKRVQDHARPPPEAMKKLPATQWVGPSVKLRIKHLRGDHAPHTPCVAVRF